MGFSLQPNYKTTILVHSIDKNVSADLLSQSALIIKNRFRDFGYEKFDVTVIPEKKQIKVTVVNPSDLKQTENLIVQKGKVEFFETYNYSGLTVILLRDNHLLSYFEGMVPMDSSVKIGCVPSTGVDKIDDYLNTLEMNQKCKFAWNRTADNSKVFTH